MVTHSCPFQFLSNYTPEALAVFAEQMYGLRAFLERNPQLFYSQDQLRSVLGEEEEEDSSNLISLALTPLSSGSSPSNVYHRMLNFMRPEGMATESPSSVQQSLTRKYKGVCLCAKLSTGGYYNIASPSPSLPLFPFLFTSLPPSLSPLFLLPPSLPPPPPQPMPMLWN